MKFLLLAIFTILVSWSEGLPEGAPPSACETLLPRHRIVGENGEKTDEYHEPQTSLAPYKFEIQEKSIPSGGSLHVTIVGGSFQGFIIRCFADDKKTPVAGQFQVTNDMQAMKCDADNDTATQTAKTEKNNLALIWKAPANYKGVVVCRGTVLKDYTTFWPIESESVTIA